LSKGNSFSDQGERGHPGTLPSGGRNSSCDGVLFRPKFRKTARICQLKLGTYGGISGRDGRRSTRELDREETRTTDARLTG
jgi:hypothetical protein